MRYGNVTGSRGSIIPKFRALHEAGESLPITDLRCTRFLITLPEAVQMVLDTFELMQGGELVVPHIPSHLVTDLAQAIAPGAKMHDIGLRPGEKLHEEMISPEEGRRAIMIMDGKYYVLEPELATWGYVPRTDGKPVPRGLPLRFRQERPCGSAPMRSARCSRRVSEVIPYGRQSVNEDDIEAVAAGPAR